MKPNTRREAFLMKHMGFDVECPEPVTREEMILANAPGGGGSGGGNFLQVMRSSTGNWVANMPYEEVSSHFDNKTLNSGVLIGEYEDLASGVTGLAYYTLTTMYDYRQAETPGLFIEFFSTITNGTKSVFCASDGSVMGYNPNEGK